MHQTDHLRMANGSPAFAGDAAPIVKMGAHAVAIGEIADGLGQEMIRTLVRALLIEVGRETARHIAEGRPDMLDG